MTPLLTRLLPLFALFIGACSPGPNTSAIVPDDAASQPSSLSTAVVAGGCFWCTEEMFQQLDGVTKVISGYSAGKEPNPTYKQVSMGKTTHTEAIEITYDPKVISYRGIIDHLWKIHDPTTLNRQGNDRGPQYRSGIYFANHEEKKIAEASMADAATSFKGPIVTELKAASPFYPAEEYHQNYYRKNPNDPYCKAVLVPKLKKLGMKTAWELLEEEKAS